MTNSVSEYLGIEKKKKVEKMIQMWKEAIDKRNELQYIALHNLSAIPIDTSAQSKIVNKT